MKAGREKALELLKSVYKTSPAYASYFNGHSKVPFAKIKKEGSFEDAPVMTKDGFIRKYPLEERLFDGKKLHDFYMICSSSGTSGEPTFWPRDYDIDEALVKMKEAMYVNLFGVNKKSTLCMITFGLGSWTAGMLTARLSWPAGGKYDFTVVTPGPNKKTALELIQKLAPYYEQIVLLGYPSFITDLVELAGDEKVDLKKAHVKIFCTGESFSEEWRDIMVRKISRTKDRHSVVGFYACSDTGIIGCESFLTIDILAKAHTDVKFCRALFGRSHVPTFVEYNPEVKYLEVVKGEILITARQPMPLIRYHISDRGGLLTKRQLKKILDAWKFPYNEAELADHYVYVSGRSDAVLLTANIYIEDIQYCIEHSTFQSRLSKYFTYGIDPTSGLRPRLKIVLNVKKGQEFTDEEKSQLQEEFYKNLLSANDDFKMIQSGITIEKFLFEYQSVDEDFNPKNKHKFFL